MLKQQPQKQQQISETPFSDEAVRKCQLPEV